MARASSLPHWPTPPIHHAAPQVRCRLWTAVVRTIPAGHLAGLHPATLVCARAVVPDHHTLAVRPLWRRHPLVRRRTDRRLSRCRIRSLDGSRRRTGIHPSSGFAFEGTLDHDTDRSIARGALFDTRLTVRDDGSWLRRRRAPAGSDAGEQKKRQKAAPHGASTISSPLPACAAAPPGGPTVRSSPREPAVTPAVPLG